jgi:Ca2+-binding RTX toxin-like protein
MRDLLLAQDATEGDDLITGFSTADTIDALGGNDTVYGGTGNDTIAGGAGNDTLDGGDGHDSMDGGSGNDFLDGGNGDDLIYGGDGDDLIHSGTGNDAVFAQAGQDTIIAGEGAGNDSYYGGDGIDLITFPSTSQGITVDLAAGTATGPEIDNDLLSGIENVEGGSGNDTLSGTDGVNWLAGVAGSDLLEGRAGDDTLVGGAGDDTLVGGDGEDRAVFSGDFADYQMTDLGGGSYEVVDLRVASPDGTDLLIDVENLEFADQVVDLDAPLPPVLTAVAGDHLLRVLADGSISGDLDPGVPAMSLGTDVANGSLTFNGDGTYSYTPTVGFSGVDSFTYFAGPTEQTVRIEVGLAGTGPAQLVNNVVGQNESSADLTALTGGGYLVTWVVSSGGADQGVYAQRFDTNGAEVGSEIFIPKPGAQNVSAFNPVATELADETFVLMWQWGNANDPGLRALRYASDGTQLSVSEMNIDGGPRGERDPEITALEDGGFAVAWDRDDDQGHDDILVRTFDADGTPRTAALSLDIGAGNHAPAILALPGGEFLVAWIADDGNEVAGQRFDAATGSPLAGTVTLATAAPGETAGTVDLALLAGGNFMAVWSESNADADGYGLMMRNFNPDGTPAAGAFAVNEGQAGDQLMPSVTALAGADDNFLVTWVTDDGVSDSAIYARAFTLGGIPVGEEFVVSAGMSGDQTNPEVILLEDGRLAFSWSGPDGSGDGIYTRILSLGTDNHDNLQGDAQDDVMRGFGGADVLVGNDGDDILIGGAGADTLVGGTGADTFAYNDIMDVGDLIDGFDATGPDSIDLDGLLDSLGIADADRAGRVEVQQAGIGQDAIVAVDTTGNSVFDTVVATVTNVTGELDQNDLNLGALV